MNLAFLDTGPLGRISHPRASPQNLQCREWARSLVDAGFRIVVPEICIYEIRRELLRVRATTGLARLDLIKTSFHFAPLTTAAMIRAAELWAEVRRRGLPTAGPDRLDADAILAAQALVAVGPSDTVFVATENVRHLGRFVDARLWNQFTP
jgi:predicted nucleic acid-binding protein